MGVIDVRIDVQVDVPSSRLKQAFVECALANGHGCVCVRVCVRVCVCVCACVCMLVRVLPVASCFEHTTSYTFICSNF